MSKKLKVIVCGSVFGEFYLEAISRLTDDFILAGLLARGSQKSYKIAKAYNIPLYKRIDDIPEDIDLACIIIRGEGVGGEGTDLCVSFLKRGIAVLHEQPVFQSHLKKCYKASKVSSAPYITANLYSNFDNSTYFINCARKLNKLSNLVYINASFSTQLAYVAMDIISQTGIAGNLKLNDIKKLSGPFDLLTGKIGDLPIVIEFNNRLNPKQVDHYMHLMYSFNFYYEDGLLILSDTYGDVAWRPRSYLPITKEYEHIYREPIYSRIASLSDTSLNIYNFYKTEWIRAIAGELKKIKHLVQKGEMDIKVINRELETARKWENLQRTAGYARFTTEFNTKFVSLEDIKN